MNRTDAITRLQANADAVRAMGATALYLLGSTVRDRAKLDSDLDLFIEYDAGQKFSLFDLVGIKLFLEERLGTEVGRDHPQQPAPAPVRRHRAIGYPRFLMAPRQHRHVLEDNLGLQRICRDSVPGTFFPQ